MERFARALDALAGHVDAPKERAALIQRVRRMCDNARNAGVREGWAKAWKHPAYDPKTKP